jgi:hypothetical protein
MTTDRRTNQMSISSAACFPARVGGLTGRCRAWFAQIADRAHASGDAQARAAGWTVTVTGDPFGLSGRAYRDPRFGPHAGAVSPQKGQR